jgi:glycerol-3-phosphate dehydrogenase
MVCILGAGIAGLSIARDLTLRGIKCMVIDKNMVGSGTTTRCAGMLHSGARYAVKSQEIASLLMKENRLINQLIPFAVSSTNGLYLVLKGDEEYSEKFEDGCNKANIPFEKLSAKESLILEPNINPSLIRSYRTFDGTINPYLLIESHLEFLLQNDIEILESQMLFEVKRKAEKWNIRLSDRSSGQIKSFTADVVVNATGTSVASIAKMFGADLTLVLLHGALIVFNNKLVNSLVTRCAPSSVGDVVAASGDRCLAAATSNDYACSEYMIPSDQDTREVLNGAAQLIPKISNSAIIHAFSGIRVHIAREKNNASSGFNVLRDYAILDHQSRDSIPGLITVLAGKLILFRHVAEVACDLIASRCGNSTRCTTRKIPLEYPISFSGRHLCHLPVEAEMLCCEKGD